MKKQNINLYLASPRGFCAGVDRAVKIVEETIKKFGSPVYIRHEIVHNKQVVEDLKKKGAIFVNELSDIKDNTRPVIFSAHGVPKTVPEEAKIQTEAVFINGFYDFQPFSLKSTSITPYLGGGVGISRNKMKTTVEHNNGIPTGLTFDGNTINQFAYKLSAGTLISLTEQLSLDVNYQYVNLGAFKGGTEVLFNGDFRNNRQRGFNGGEIKSQELMVGLQYTFK